MTFMIMFMQWKDKLDFCSDQQFLKIDPFIRFVTFYGWFQMNIIYVNHYH
jgi:hypothetical protein